MLAHLLKRFERFAALDERTLAMASKHASLIELPANRWLLRRGRRLDRCLYLLEGAVEAVGPGGRRRRVEGEIYRPGDDIALETRAGTRVLSVDLAPIEFLCDRTASSGRSPVDCGSTGARIAAVKVCRGFLAELCAERKSADCCRR